MNKDKSLTLFMQGIVFLEQGSLFQAIDNFNKAITTDPTTTVVYRYRGLAYQQQGNNSAAIQDWRKALQISKQRGNKRYYDLVQSWLKKLGASELPSTP